MSKKVVTVMPGASSRVARQDSISGLAWLAQLRQSRLRVPATSMIFVAESHLALVGWRCACGLTKINSVADVTRPWTASRAHLHAVPGALPKCVGAIFVTFRRPP